MVKNTFYALFLMLFFASCGPKAKSGGGSDMIIGTQWQLVGLDGYGYDADQIMVELALADARSFIIFDRDSTFMGSGICYKFTGSYSMDRSGNIKLMPQRDTLENGFCEYSAIEGIIFESMTYIDHYKVENDTLKLTDDFGKNLLIYTRQK